MSFVEKAVERMKERAARAEEQRRPASTSREPIAKVSPDRPKTVPEDAYAATMTALFIEIDRARLHAEGFLAPAEYERRLAEEYRHIKRPLLANAFGLGVPKVEDGNLIMVGSAMSGEGKTHTCINLALSMATEKDRTVLLVDADVAKPTVSRLFGLGHQSGLLDVLTGDKPDVGSVLIGTDVPKLRILPAGKPRDHSTELLASDRMRSIAQELATRYPDRIILFDSPPLLATTEAVVLAGLVGQIAIVVAADSTARAAVREAVARLDRGKAINFILNKSRGSSGGDYYGYGQYGQHGERGNDENT